MCRAQTAPLLVMDVEGADGRERGEDQDFERKSAIFSLASSEVSTRYLPGLRLDHQCHNTSPTVALPS